MKSGETAGQGNGHPCADRTASEARRPEAGSRAVGVSRAERGNDGSPKGRDAAGGSMRSTTARPAMFLGRGRPCSRGDAEWIFCGGQTAFAALVLPIRRSRFGCIEERQASRGGDMPRFPWRQAKRAQRRRREEAGNRRSRKRVRRPRRTTHRRQRGAISSPPAPSSTATARSRPAQRTRKPARPRSAR